MIELLTQLLSQPITQFGTLVALATGLHKLGIIDLRAMLRSAVGASDGVHEVTADVRGAMQPLLSQMELLTRYANHETTDNLHEVQEGIERLREKQDRLITVTESVVAVLTEIRINGIRCRKD